MLLPGELLRFKRVSDARPKERCFGLWLTIGSIAVAILMYAGWAAQVLA